jgi:hypothetical protein
MSEPMWMDGDPIALGTDDEEEKENDYFGHSDDAYDAFMEK